MKNRQIFNANICHFLVVQCWKLVKSILKSTSCQYLLHMQILHKETIRLKFNQSIII